MYKHFKISARQKISAQGFSVSVGAVLLCLGACAVSHYAAYFIGLIEKLLPEIHGITYLFLFLKFLIFSAVFLLFSPLLLGAFRVFVLIARGEKPKLSQVFYYKGNGLYKSAFIFSFFMMLKVYLRALISFIPLMVCILVFLLTPVNNSINPLLGTVIISVLAVAGVFLLIFLSASLLYAPVSFTMMPRVSVGNHFRRSKEICKNRKAEIVLFFLYFTHWFLLGFFVIPLLWTVPYFLITSVIFSFSLEEKYNKGYQSGKISGGIYSQSFPQDKNTIDNSAVRSYNLLQEN